MGLHLFYAEAGPSGRRVALLLTAAGSTLPEAQAAAVGRLEFLDAPVSHIRFIARTDRPLLDVLGNLE